MKKTVLLVDNDKDFLDTWAGLLHGAGYHIFKADSLNEARRILAETWIHLAILDIRMREDTDDKDISGLTFAKEPAIRSIPKIMLTDYPTVDGVRKALGYVFDDTPPAVDYVSKKTEDGRPNLDELLTTIEKAFNQHLNLNWELNFHWGDKSLAFPVLIYQIEPEVDSAYLPDRVSELEALFRKIFYDSSQITISRLLTKKMGVVFLVVVAYPKQGSERQFVIACGSKLPIVEADTRYKKFAPKVANQVGTVKNKTEETVHFAAIAYGLGGGDLEEITTFSKFYRNNSIEAVLAAVDHLFTTPLATWYEKGRFREEDRTLKQFFLERPEPGSAVLSHIELERHVKIICSEILSAGLIQLDYSPHQLTLHLPDASSVSYPNPLPFFSETRMVFNTPILCGTIYGQLNGDGVLVDRQGRTWLIDFSQTDRGPLVRDFVSLETALKFELLSTPDIQARYEMERRLASVFHLDQEIDLEGLEPEIQKTLQAIGRIRRQASRVMGDELKTYLGGLLFCAMGRLAAYDPTVRHTRNELIPYLHSLLSAAILCQHLMPAPKEDLPLQALHSLWIDENNKEVWVEGRRVTLSSQEFELLLYLYRHQGQLCQRITIAEQVFGASYEPGMSEADKRRIEEGRLNSTMSRLRKKLEPNPNHPKYISVVRGEGYRLELVGGPLTKITD